MKFENESGIEIKPLYTSEDVTATGGEGGIDCIIGQGWLLRRWPQGAYCRACIHVRELDPGRAQKVVNTTTRQIPAAIIRTPPLLGCAR